MVCVYVLDTSQKSKYFMLSIYRFRETDSDLYLLTDGCSYFCVSFYLHLCPAFKKNSHPVNSKIGSGFESDPTIK